MIRDRSVMTPGAGATVEGPTGPLSRHGWRLAAVALLFVALATGGVAHAQARDLDVALFRTRLGEDLTVVDGVVEFDLEAVRDDSGCEYHVMLGVKDSSGTTILEEGWEGACEADEVEPGRTARLVETFQFAIQPGRYTVDVSVAPSGRPESIYHASVELVNLPMRAVVSDLILGRSVGAVDTTAPQNWTVRKGQVGIAADPYVVTDQDRSTLGYYLEVYPEAGVEGAAEVVCVIRHREGDEIVRTRLATLEAAEVFRPIVGNLSLAGLPPGRYTMDVEVKLPDTSVTRSRGFAMAAPANVRPVAPSPLTRRLEEYFFGLENTELERLFDPIVVWLGSGDRRMYEGLTSEGKRNFLIDYFVRVAPSVVGDDEDPLDIWLERVRHVEEQFGEKAGRQEQAAWRTDRGRIYLLRGQPSQQLTRPFPRDDAPPYEIWSYEVGPGYVYLFVDETRFGHYRLVFSTDPAETPLPNWQARVGRVTLTELEQYFGIRVDPRN